MKVSMDMAGIKDRADVYLHARESQGPFNCPVTASESADDVPVLIAEVERLEAELAQARVEHEQVFDALEREKYRNPARTNKKAPW